MNVISINGVNVSASGSICISNGKVIVNGIDVTPETKEINIIVNGDTDKIQVDACNSFHSTGKVGDIKTMSGDVNVYGDVEGSIQTMSGDVDCHKVSGSIKTMSGSIRNS